MSISRDDVQHIAQLARMRLTDNEVTELATQLSGILEHIAVLQEADVSAVPPSTATLTPIGPDSATMSDDRIVPSYPPDELLANAPEREGNYARVKAVLE
ncbi:MAG TPA: Asp-tRNA(Asn)/Glu-tRNA(Gln) amidotransferase subunit GatC [Ktedonobacterales bacterium]|nr:Asp-tRNA(Asn)/Glu-tRNA(Gln) amidotransferase subunit GatC [Ktedonobacterales bacterium]